MTNHVTWHVKPHDLFGVERLFIEFDRSGRVLAD